MERSDRNNFPRIPLNWTVGFAKSATEPPAERVPAQVPGAVQLDWARAKGWGPYYFDENWKEYGWMEDVYWTYQTTLDGAALNSDQRLYFICKGIDYRYEIRLNGSVIEQYEGMFRQFQLDLTGKAKAGYLLEIVIWPAPKSMASPVDRNQANQSCKPAVSYGWDFHPRLIPLSIWDETHLEIRPNIHIQRAETRASLQDDLSEATVTLDVALSQTGPGQVRWQVIDPSGEVISDQNHPANASVTFHAGATFAKPALWWPIGQGEPSLYTSQVQLLDQAGKVVQETRSRVGIRRVRLVMHEGQWDWPGGMDFPKGPSNPPITLEINNRRIFAKGSNWVNPNIFPGAITAETYRPLLQLAKDANMNLLRLWGGAIINKDTFYEQCDELGLMIWQEFPLACNRYEGSPEYLAVLDSESKAIIQRLRHHACIVLWCGGNELFNNWSLMTEQDLSLRLLDRNCYDLDPRRPFLKTSPVMGMGHGPYLFRNPDGTEIFQMSQRASCTAYTEFGVGGPSPMEVIRSIIPEQDLYPPRRGTAWVSHHAFDAWGGDWGSWLMLHLQDDYFGPHENLEQIIERGQLLQSEGLKAIFEEARRQKPRAAMSLNWCFNEPWPCAANNSIVAWPAVPKPAYYAVAGSLRNVLASARLAKFRWNEGEWFDPELWLLNDSPQPVKAGRIEAFLKMGEREIFLLGWDFSEVEPNVNLPGPKLRFKLPTGPGGRMQLILRGPKGLASSIDSTYTLMFVPAHRPSEVEGARPLNQ